MISTKPGVLLPPVGAARRSDIADQLFGFSKTKNVAAGLNLHSTLLRLNSSIMMLLRFTKCSV